MIKDKFYVVTYDSDTKSTYATFHQTFRTAVAEYRKRKEFYDAFTPECKVYITKVVVGVGEEV